MRHLHQVRLLTLHVIGTSVTDVTSVIAERLRPCVGIANELKGRREALLEGHGLMNSVPQAWISRSG